jgi:hypothetical protein
MPIKQTLSREERNRRAMNGLPIDAPRPERRKESERKPMMDLDAMDEAAELEIARKAQLEEKEKSRLAHLAKLEASAPAPKPAK